MAHPFVLVGGFISSVVVIMIDGPHAIESYDMIDTIYIKVLGGNLQTSLLAMGRIEGRKERKDEKWKGEKEKKKDV